ncbi:MAG: hypothetical protein M1829_004169 [Trizodia sp. TS-e1964]|nr:MAG: hypothetical protein M1829_004169 [Trizodia sp. TS-e1964]
MPPSTHPTHLRALYRALLRELPTSRSPLHARVRSAFLTPPQDPAAALRSVQAARECCAYVRAQRCYVTLLERYNPGMGADEKKRVELSARRVGLGMPDVFLRE